MSDPVQQRILFGAILGAGAVGLAVAAVLFASRPGLPQRTLARFADRSWLPVPPGIAAALERHLRRRTVVEFGCASGGAVACGLLLLSPLGVSRIYPLAVFVPVILLTGLLGTTTLALRDRLFAPASGAPRIARSRVTTSADYLGQGARALTWVLCGAAAASAAWAGWALARGGVARPALGAAALVAAGLALAVCVALPHIERAVLARPQPAETGSSWPGTTRCACPR